MQESAKKQTLLSRVFGSSTRVISVSFAMVILAGTLLLMMPFSARDGHFTNPLDALFTATSATCVTGLIVFDTFTKWTTFGQIVILALIQIGGLGLVTFTTFFNVLIGRKLGLRSMQLAQESINSSSMVGITKLVKMVVLVSFLIEMIGMLSLCLTFVPKYGAQGVFISFFLAISAFCNAGFDILGREGEYSSLIHYNGNFNVILTIALLIIIGGLGFAVWNDLINYRKTKKLLLHTKIVLLCTGALIVVGTLAFLIIEWSNPATIGEMPFYKKVLNSFFQSVTLRTAGFNSIPLEPLNGLTKMVSIVLMFIGAAPGSTGGGIKVTTFMVIVMTVVSVVKGRDDTVILKRKVNKQVVYKSLSVMMIGVLAVATCSIIIFFTTSESHMVSGLDACFESVSAFATVGVSTGVTSIANVPSKIVLILSMFLGRVGPVSLALSLAMRGSGNKKEVIPEGKIIVG